MDYSTFAMYSDKWRDCLGYIPNLVRKGVSNGSGSGWGNWEKVRMREKRGKEGMGLGEGG